jgi:hypothetical protein
LRSAARSSARRMRQYQKAKNAMAMIQYMPGVFAHNLVYKFVQIAQIEIDDPAEYRPLVGPCEVRPSTRLKIRPAARCSPPDRSVSSRAARLSAEPPFCGLTAGAAHRLPEIARLQVRRRFSTHGLALNDTLGEPLRAVLRPDGSAVDPPERREPMWAGAVVHQIDLVGAPYFRPSEAGTWPTIVEHLFRDAAAEADLLVCRHA